MRVVYHCVNVTEAKSTALGSFLRWHRHRLTPREVGLPEYGRRRVPGLRREEVANLAGISTEYYIRLEQGRERTPSPNVVDALADALRLDADQTAHLRNIARPVSRRSAGGRRTDIPEGATRLLEHLTLPAVILNRYMDVMASNPPAQALFPNMEPGDNRIRAVFLDPREREFWRDWEQAVSDSVAQLRADIGNELEVFAGARIDRRAANTGAGTSTGCGPARTCNSARAARSGCATTCSAKSSSTARNYSSRAPMRCLCTFISPSPGRRRPGSWTVCATSRRVVAVPG